MASGGGLAVGNANPRLLQERLERAQEQLFQLQSQVAQYDAVAETLVELPKKLSHKVMVPLGKRAMMPGKLVRTNEVLAHLGDEYFAWRTVPSAIEIIDRRKKDLTKQIKQEESSLEELNTKKKDVDSLVNMKKIYDEEDIREIQETEEESDFGPVPHATEEDIAEYFEVEEEERRKNEEHAVWNWDDMMRRMEELEAREAHGDDGEDEAIQETAAENPAMQAATLKANGNDAFAKRNFADSARFYSQAIALDPSSHILYGNRSAAYYRLKKFKEALDDANVAIKLNDTWVKGHYRKACALAALNEYEAAANAFDRAFEICPTDLKLAEKAKEMKMKLLDHQHHHIKQKSTIADFDISSVPPPSPTVIPPVVERSVPAAATTTSAGASATPPPINSSSAVFSGKIMEREITDTPPSITSTLNRDAISPFASSSFKSTAPRTSRFIGSNPDSDIVTLEPVGEAQPVKRVSRFKAARAQPQ